MHARMSQLATQEFVDVDVDVNGLFSAVEFEDVL